MAKVYKENPDGTMELVETGVVEQAAGPQQTPPPDRVAQAEAMLPERGGGVPGVSPAPGQMDARKQSVMTNALIGGATGGPVGAAIGGATAASKTLNPNPQNLGADVGAGAMELGANALLSRVPGGGAMATALKGAGKGVAMGAGMQIGQALQDHFMGQPSQLPSGGNIFVTPVMTGTIGMLGAVVPRGVAAVMRHFSQSPNEPFIRAANRLGAGAVSESDFGLSRLAGSDDQAKMVDRLFPVEMSADEAAQVMSRTRQTFDAAVDGQTFRGKLEGQTFDALGQSRSKLAESVRDLYNLSGDDIKVFKEAFNAPPEQFLDKLFGNDVVGSARRLESLTRMIGKDDPALNEVAQHWVRRSLLGGAATTTAKGETVLDGKAFASQVAKIEGPLNEVFNPEAAGALKKLGELMQTYDPQRIAAQQASHAQAAKTGFSYAKNVLAFGIGGRAMATGNMAGAAMTALTIGVAPLVAAALIDSSIPYRLEKALGDATGASLNSFIRGLSSGEQQAPVEGLAPRVP